MALSSIDGVVSSISSGKTWMTEWNKITTAGITYTAGRWYDFSMLAGHPIANAWAGTSLAYTACTEAAGNGTQIFGMRHGGDVSTDIKHAMNIAAVTAVATGVPGTLMLVDMQGYWPGINMNTLSVQNLTGTPSPRYTNGVGLRLYLATVTTTGASAHNLSISYTDQDGNTGNTMPVTVACTASAVAGHITHSGVAANNYGPFLPLASGDYGVRNVASVTLSAASGAGTAALVLARPLLKIPVTTVSILSERDLINQIPSMPRIYDGACLTWLYFAGAATAANTNFYGSLETVWG